MYRFRVRIGFCLALVAISLIVLGLPGLAPTAAAAELQPNAQALARVMQVQDRNTDRLMRLKGVVGTATGLDAAGQPVIKVFVVQAGAVAIAKRLEGVPVVVEVTGHIFALKPGKGGGVDTTARFDRPVPIGVSTGHPDITAGTIGCRVTDGMSVFALSNNHVYANENLAGIDNDVLQPGTFDGGTAPADSIGLLFDFEEIKFDGSNNTIDAAIAISSTKLLGNATPSDGYGTPKSEIVAASINLEVKKYGRTTSLTNGTVDAINATFNVGYRSGVARFVDQIVIKPGKFSAGGDSGSLVVTREGNNPVGLLFAGSRTITIANPIGLVLARFGVTVDGEGAAPPANDTPVVSITSPVDATFDSGAAISFAGTATDTEDDDTTLTAKLVWTSNIGGGTIGSGGGFSTTLSDGNYTITASVTDSGGATGSASISITVGTPPAEATMVFVVSITYDTEGGKNGDKHLLTTVTLVDDDRYNAVGGASVSIELCHEGALCWSGIGTTGGDGTVTFTLKNARAGCYTTMITGVIAGLPWDGGTPNNGSCK